MLDYLKLIETLLKQGKNGEVLALIAVGILAIEAVLRILGWLYTKYYDTVVSKEFATFKSTLDDESATKIETLKSELSTESAEKIETLKSELSTESAKEIETLKSELSTESAKEIETLKSELSTESAKEITELKIELKNKSIKEIEQLKDELYKTTTKEIEQFKSEIESKNTKEIEALKSKLQNKNYITKTKFDMEFKLYIEVNRIINEIYSKSQELIVTALQYGKNQENNKLAKEIFQDIQNLTAISNKTLMLMDLDVLEFIRIYMGRSIMLLNEVDKIEDGDECYRTIEIVDVGEIIEMNIELNMVFMMLKDSYIDLVHSMKDVINSYEIIE